MSQRDPRVDAYVAKSPGFAQPILAWLRETVHTACPDAQETMKWSVPHFEYHGILCSMAAFKQHCAFGFWKGRLLLDDTGRQHEAMGDFGRITTLKDLPTRAALGKLIKQAMRLNEQGASAPKSPPKKAKPELAVPADFAAALKAAPKAHQHFEAFTPGKRREYLDWIVEAKRAETRQRRIAQAVQWLAEGKSRHWKYENC